MDARGSFDPQLHGICPDVIAAPEGRPRNGRGLRVVDVLERRLGHAETHRGGAHRGVEMLARSQRLTLRACPGADTPLPVARFEVRVAFGIRRLQYHTLD